MNQRQTDIPRVSPGDPLSASLVNQMVKGASRNRVVTGDDLSVSMIGNTLGIADERTAPNSDRGVLVEVQPYSASDGFDTGFYRGRIYYQANLGLKIKAGTSPSLNPSPDKNTCIVLNLGEIAGGSQITSAFTTIGRSIGFTYGGSPLVAVTGNLSVGFKPVLVKANGTDGTNTTYDLYALSDTGYVTKLNLAGALAPKCSRARWQTVLTVTAATDGTVGEAYYDSTGAIQLYNCQEFVPMGACT